MYLKTAVFKSTLLLIWCQQQVPLFVPLGRNVTREVASFLVEWELLPGIFNQRLYLVNVGVMRCTRETKTESAVCSSRTSHPMKWLPTSLTTF